jgi:cytochrome c oxidase subunit IV
MTDGHDSTITDPEVPTDSGVTIDTDAVDAPGGAHLPQEAGGHGAHPTDAKYVKVAVILAVITGVEVTVSYARGLGDAAAPLLLALAAIKFFLVGAFFMHLRFDNPVLRRLFVTGIVLACTIYTIVFLLLGVFTGTHGHHG